MPCPWSGRPISRRQKPTYGRRQGSAALLRLRLAPKGTCSVRPPLAMRHVAALGSHIPHVVVACASEQVVRSDAGRVVAVVQDTKVVGNGAKVDFPRNPMSALFPICAQQSAVSIGIRRPRPYPTGAKPRTMRLHRAGLVDFRPEARLDAASRSVGMVAARRAVQRPTALDVLCRSKKVGATCLTHADDGPHRDWPCPQCVLLGDARFAVGAVGRPRGRLSPLIELRQRLDYAAFRARLRRRGSMVLHPEPPTPGATPRPSYPRRGVSCCVNYIRSFRVEAR